MTTSTHLHRAFPGPSVDEAFRDFVQINTPALTRTAYVLTGSASAAEEMVQDTLVRLYPQWARVQNADAPLAYARRALTNRILTVWRRNTGREVITDTVPDRPAVRNAENDIADHDEVWALLQTLSGRQRTALVLRYYEGLSDAEIGEILGARYGTVRSLISRGLATLRETCPIEREAS
jgi:RNA polymerase sigma-70 factor (sigma-E family)